MKRARCLLGALTLCVVTQAQGAAVYGAGNTSCTRWIENREFGEGWAELQEWALGYLTGINDNTNVSAQETDGDAVIALLDDYCRRNPQQSLLDATRTLTQPPGIRIAGLGNTEGELGNQTQMNEICRTTYPYRTEGAFPVRWATTADFREYSTSKGWNHQMTRIEEPLSLRAAHTTFTQDGRAYDQATGAISAPGSRPYPGAVLFEDNAARFGGRRFTAKPLCVWGPPNNDLRD